MNRLSATMMTVTALTLATPAWAGSRLPEPRHSRVILHGVDCSITNGTVCNTDRPIFDEAITSLPDTGVVVIQTQVLEDLGGEPTSALQKGSAAAVRDYFIGGGIAPERVAIEGCIESPGRPSSLDWSQPTEVQLSKTWDE